MSSQKKIEPFKHEVMADPDYAEKTWKLLEQAINEVYNDNSSELCFEELYRNGYYMVLHKNGEKLYCGLTDTVTLHLKEMARSIEAAQGGFFLEELNRKWEAHVKALCTIQDILMYMDRTFIRNTLTTPIHKLGLNLWRDNVIRSDKILKRLVHALLELINRERTGEIIDRGLVRNITKMLMDLGSSVYQDDFEQPFLEASTNFYSSEAQQLIECCDSGDYLKKVERRLDKEKERAFLYLDFSTEEKITEVVKTEMILNQMRRLVHKENSGLINMLVTDKYEDLARMYRLVHGISNGLSLVQDVMTNHLRESGMKLVYDVEKHKNPVEFIQLLLDKKDKYDKIISTAFSNEMTFQNALNKAFVYFINLNARSPEFLSLYLDNKLCHCMKGVSEEDGEIILDKVMTVFRYIQEKDMFEKYYKRHLAKRLLSGKMVSEDKERSLVLKLKNECGYPFTSNIEGMFTDMKTSRDTMQEFYAKEHSDTRLSVLVLTTGYWPWQTIPSCKLPSEILPACKKFESFYLGAHFRRRLSWQTNMGSANIKATFGENQKHELKVSTYQMCILMLFNSSEKLSYRDIEHATMISSPDLKHSLQSLACMNGKNVLIKEPMTKDVSENDIFFVNDKFSSKFYKVKICTVAPQKETELEKTETRQRAEEHRMRQIEAAIVRIMKKRKVMDLNDMVAEVIKHLQSQFVPNPVLIKKRIESLVEREFLERDKNDRRLCRYVA